MGGGLFLSRITGFCQTTWSCRRSGTVSRDPPKSASTLGGVYIFLPTQVSEWSFRQVMRVHGVYIFLPTQVSELSFRQVMKTPLRSGVRPPLLSEVLNSAAAISEEVRIPPRPEIFFSSQCSMLWSRVSILTRPVSGSPCCSSSSCLPRATTLLSG